MSERAPTWLRNHRWLQRLLIAVTGVSISTKIMGIVLALTILLGLAVTLQVRNLMTKVLQAELHDDGIAVARDLAGRATLLLAAGEQDALETLLRETINNHADSRYAFVLDAQGQVLASVSRAEDGGILVDIQVAPAVLDAHLINAPHSHRDYRTDEGLIHDFSIPIIGDEPGLVRLGLVETRLTETLSAVTEQMWLTTLLVAGVGILAAMLLTWLLTRPILDLVTTTDRLRQGDLTVRAPHWTDDEIGALSDAFNQMVCELESSQHTVIEKENARTHLLSRLISAQEEERKRIARELHDGVGQALTSILVHIRALAQNADPTTKTRMAELHQLVNQTLTDVRLLSRELRPSALDDLGLAAALERYIVEFGVRYPEIEVDLHFTLPYRLPPNLETSLYRIIQEAMTNAARHSRATSLSVVVSVRGGAVHAIVEDNGEGFDVESTRRAGSSVGLHSMNERSELLNGTLEIESSRDGTTVYVEMPLTSNEMRGKTISETIEDKSPENKSPENEAPENEAPENETVGTSS